MVARFSAFSRRIAAVVCVLASSACAQVVTNRVVIIPTADGTATGELRLRERQANGTNYVGLKAPPVITANKVWELPVADGALGDCLQTNGTAQLLFLSCSGGLPVIDTTSLVKGSADDTKLLRFEVDGFTTATTRILTPPDADITIAGINLAQTWTSIQTHDADIFMATTRKIAPSSTGNANLGSTALHFGSAWVNNANIYTDLFLDSAARVSGDLIPSADVTYRLGNSTTRWHSSYIRDAFFLLSASPQATGAANLGSSSLRWASQWVNNVNLYSNLFFDSAATFSGSIIPSADGSYQIGNSTNRLHSAYIKDGFFQTSAKPQVTGAANLGSSTLHWGSAWIDTIDTTDIFGAGRILYGLASTDVSSGLGAIISKDAFVSATATTNASVGSFAAIASNYVALASSRTGSGTYLPLAFFTSASKRWEIDTSGHFLPGATTTYNVGSSSLRPNVVYADIINSTQGVTTPSGNFTGVISVRNAADTASCTISINGGVIYASTC